MSKIQYLLDDLENISGKQFILTEEEEEVTLKLLKDLEGQTVIRATTILECTLELIKFSQIKINGN